MADRSPARWLAPLALVAAGLVLIVVIGTSLSSSDSAPEPPVNPPATTTTRASTARKAPAARPAGHATGPTGATGATGKATYTVQTGDYLSTVAEKTGVPVDRLRELNPGLDANSMSVGQEIRLRP